MDKASRQQHISFIETYQGEAFIQGIIASCKELKDEILNSYVNLECNNIDNLSEINVHYEGISWEDFRKRGLVEMNLFSFSNIAKKNFISFLDERISQGCYILLYKIDEYYLSYSKYFQLEHYIHDTYIYGFDEKDYYVMAYQGVHLRLFEVKKNEIVNGIYKSRKENCIQDFCSFRPSINVKIKASKKKFLKGLDNYLNGGVDKSTSTLHGINVYDAIKKSIQNEIKRSKFKKVADIRCFRMIWEHKKLLSVQIDEFFSQKENKDVKIKEEISKVEEIAHRMFLLSIKYNVTFNPEILERIKLLLDLMIDVEKTLYIKLLSL